MAKNKRFAAVAMLALSAAVCAGLAVTARGGGTSVEAEGEKSRPAVRFFPKWKGTSSKTRGRRQIRTAALSPVQRAAWRFRRAG